MKKRTTLRFLLKSLLAIILLAACFSTAFSQSCDATCPANHLELHDHAGGEVLADAPEKSMLSTFSGTVQYPNGTIQYSRMIIYDPVTFEVKVSANVCIGNAPFNISVTPGIYNVYYRPYQVGALPYEAKNVNLNANLDTTLVLASYTTPAYFDELSWSKVAIFADNNETVNIVAKANGAFTISEIFLFNEFNFINPAVGYVQGKIILKDDGLGSDLLAGDGKFTSPPIKWDPATGFSRSNKISSAFLAYFQVNDVVNGVKDYKYLGTTTRLGIVNPSVTDYTPLTQVDFSLHVNDYLINIVRPPGYNHTGDAMSVYSIYPDSFDFINIFHTNYQVGTSVANFHFGVQNQVMGIGTGIGNNTAAYGSAGNLQGISVFPALDYAPPLNHETLHQWSQFMNTLFNGNSYGNHNGYTTIDGVHGGIVPPLTILSPTSVTFSQAVTFGYSSDQKAFSNLELYLMGAVDTSSIADHIYTLYNPVFQGGNTYSVSSISDITPLDIVNTYGYRSPSPLVADSDFKVANVVVSDAPLTNAALAFYTYLVKTWSNEVPEVNYLSFQEAAQSNATMTAVLPIGCTALVSPANGAVNVPATTSLAWSAATINPSGYKLRAGTTPGGTDIFNNFDVGNVLTFDPPGDLPYNTNIYVTVIAYNAAGDAAGCAENNFTTGPEPLVPECTQLTAPLNAATNVLVTSALTWQIASGNPSGYRLDVGTTLGGTDILNNFDVGNVTTYDPPGNFPNSATIYVKIKPYNGFGSAIGCSEESFGTSNCTPNLTIVDLVVPTGVYRSLGDLLSYDASIANGTFVTFTSDTGVSLEDIFEVEIGGIFEINIEGCSMANE